MMKEAEPAGNVLLLGRRGTQADAAPPALEITMSAVEQWAWSAVVVSVALQRARDDAGALRTAALVLRLVRTLADGGAGAPGVWLLTAGALGGGGGGGSPGGRGDYK